MEVYKKQLDSQMNMKKNQTLYGNMTGVEKQMNKDEIVAYKNFEAGHYNMIPGINSKPIKPTQFHELEKVNEHHDWDIDEDRHRLEKYGLTRDFTKDIKGSHIDAHQTSMGQLAP